MWLVSQIRRSVLQDYRKSTYKSMTLYTPSAPVVLRPFVVPVLPAPVPEPDGWQVYAGDGQSPARIRHDSPAMRDTGANLSQTNEIVVPRAYDGYKVDWRSKITFKLSKYSKWLNWIKQLQGAWLWDKFKTKGFGWMDFAAPNTELSFNMLQCGGNLVSGIRQVSGAWELVATLQLPYFPQTAITYDTHPHLFVKQVLVGKSTTVNPYWVVDKGERGGVGDLYIPFVTPGLAAIALSQLEFLPPLPFVTRLHGIPVEIDAYCFRGSDTFGLVGDDWYCLEEMLITGDPADRSKGGTWLDRRTYVDGWIGTCPPPRIGWVRQG